MYRLISLTIVAAPVVLAVQSGSLTLILAALANYQATDPGDAGAWRATRSRPTSTGRIAGGNGAATAL